MARGVSQPPPTQVAAAAPGYPDSAAWVQGRARVSAGRVPLSVPGAGREPHGLCPVRAAELCLSPRGSTKARRSWSQLPVQPGSTGKTLGDGLGLLFSLTEEAKEFPHEVLPLLFGIKQHIPPSEPLSPLSGEPCSQQGCL